MRPFVDSHIHFWDPDYLHYAWLAELPAINRLHTPAVLSEAAAGLALERIVFVQADCVPEDGLEGQTEKPTHPLPPLKRGMTSEFPS